MLDGAIACPACGVLHGRIGDLAYPLAYRWARTGDAKYFDAFLKTWRFDKAHFIDPATGEWHQLLRRDGTPIAADLGNPWKAIYHTGRAMLECKRRLERLLG